MDCICIYIQRERERERARDRKGATDIYIYISMWFANSPDTETLPRSSRCYHRPFLIRASGALDLSKTAVPEGSRKEKYSLLEEFPEGFVLFVQFAQGNLC
jgi:hypothetical protein